MNDRCNHFERRNGAITRNSEKERRRNLANEKEKGGRCAGKKNGMFNGAVSERKLYRIRYVYEKRGVTRISCMKLQRVGVYRRTWQQVPLYIQFIVITRATSNMPKYIGFTKPAAHTWKSKNVFVINYWSFRTGLCYIPMQLCYQLTTV